MVTNVHQTILHLLGKNMRQQDLTDVTAILQNIDTSAFSDSAFVTEPESGAYLIEITYNRETVQYALLNCDDGRWRTNMSVLRLVTFLSSCLLVGEPVSYDLSVGQNVTISNVMGLRVLSTLLWECPYDIRLMINGDLYVFTCTNGEVFANNEKLPNGSFNFPISRVAEIMAQVVPRSYYLSKYDESQVSNIKQSYASDVIHEDERITVYQSAVGNIIVSHGNFVLSPDKLDSVVNKNGGHNQSITESIDMYCALRKDVDFSTSIAELLEELGVTDKAMQILEREISKRK